MKEKERNFKYVKNKINENHLKQRICYRFPEHETIDQLDKVFVFDLETYKDQEFAESDATRLNNVNRLRAMWDRDLTPDEIVIEKENVSDFDGSNGNPVMNKLKYLSENHEADERTFDDKDGDDIVSSYRLL